ncbi:cactus-binding C-terminus of cactin protein-domain-containing protein [Ampelomyces quisqualis]|uniref:Splicing factor Cactin n=1 Tax=Ampelomyces quisqualis TaxID=50730 RepID=A0A6A5QMD2_AMPQU|nr:cactus-binding C-terminus of cactin protein-domain-containing protein [Ampelomyces quisqualis]
MSHPTKRPADARADDQPAKRAARSAASTNAAEEAWVADEDRFVLAQAKKKAALRVRGGRATPIDWLAVTLRFVDGGGDDDSDGELDVVDPAGVLEGLDAGELAALERDMGDYLALETHRPHRDYWNALLCLCRDARRNASAAAPAAGSVAADVDRLLAPKTCEQLDALEAQVQRKLAADEPLDYDYWEQLLRSLRVYKARAQLRRVSAAVVTERLHALRRQQAHAAAAVQASLYARLQAARDAPPDGPSTVAAAAAADPQPLLKLRAEDKGLAQTDEAAFVRRVASERRKTQKMGYVPLQAPPPPPPPGRSAADTPAARRPATATASRFAPPDSQDYSQATMALYEREAARGVEDGEEVFAAEEDVAAARPQWAGDHTPRKPRYFNRVHMGYEWNKYNQTHYDHDNPPPKVVQGYKFNIFYPHLVDQTKAPTYKIERENGRKRGQSFAPAGEDDTCLIRFIAGPPYQDIAFRIIDKEWDYSAKRERGFKSSFDKASRGILQLHFQFKKACPTPLPRDAPVLT